MLDLKRLETVMGDEKYSCCYFPMGITVDKELVKKIYEDGYIDPKSFKSVTESVCGSLIHIKFISEAQKAQFLFFYGSIGTNPRMNPIFFNSIRKPFIPTVIKTYFE